MNATQSLSLGFALLLVGCSAHGSGDHDDHGGHGDHGSHGGHGDDEGVSLAYTRWTDSHELFIELDAPVAGKPFGYHAHVTRMADNHAATSGAIAFQFAQDGAPKKTIKDSHVARPGIFSSTAAAPDAPGDYELSLWYADGDERASWSLGTVRVGTSPVAGEDPPEGEITFLKEAQWQIPFRVELPEQRAVHRVSRVAGQITPDPRLEAIVTAPTTGVVLWDREGGPPVVGAELVRGELLGHLVGAASAEHWTSVRMEAESARTALQRASTDLERLEPLVADGLVSELRLVEARSVLRQAEARVQAAEGRERQLAGSSGRPIPLKAAASGVISALRIPHGEAVQAGTPLLLVADPSSAVLRARLPATDMAHIDEVRWGLVTQPGNGVPTSLEALGAEPLTQGLVVEPGSQSVPVAWRLDDSGGLRLGEQVVLELGLGSGTTGLAVPRSAVVEVNTRPYLFVIIGGESFTRRAVKLGAHSAEWVEVVAGLGPHERVVTEGGFDVYVASLGGALESHRH